MKNNTYITSISKNYATCKNCYIVFKITLQDSSEEIEMENNCFFEKINKNIYQISSKYIVESKDLRSHINWLTKQLNPYKKFMLKLKDDKKAKLELICYWNSKHGYGGPALWSKHIKSLYGFSANLNFEFFYE